MELTIVSILENQFVNIDWNFFSILRFLSRSITKWNVFLTSPHTQLFSFSNALQTFRFIAQVRLYKRSATTILSIALYISVAAIDDY